MIPLGGVQGKALLDGEALSHLRSQVAIAPLKTVTKGRPSIPQPPSSL